MVHVRGPGGIGGEGRLAVETLMRTTQRPGLGTQRDPGHPNVDRGKRIRSRHRPVAPAGKPRPGPDQIPEGVLACRRSILHERQRERVELLLVRGPQHLEVRDRIHLREPVCTGLSDRLQMREVLNSTSTGMARLRQLRCHQ